MACCVGVCPHNQHVYIGQQCHWKLKDCSHLCHVFTRSVIGIHREARTLCLVDSMVSSVECLLIRIFN